MTVETSPGWAVNQLTHTCSGWGNSVRITFQQWDFVLCRAAVAAALLCTAQTQLAQQETALHLQHFLTSNASTTADSSRDSQSAKSTLLAETLSTLSSAAQSSKSFPDTLSSDIFQTSHAAACVPALVQLLESVTASGSKTTLSVLAQWFKSSIASAVEQYPSDVLIELLPVVVPALRSSETQLLTSGLSELAQQKLAHSAKLPPIAALIDGLQSSDQSADCVQALDIVCSCFPCSSTSAGNGQATTAGADVPTGTTTAAERQALLAAAVRQMQGERSVAVAAAAARRFADGQEAQPSSSAAASPSALTFVHEGSG